MRFVHWLEFWGSWKCPCQSDCPGLCVSGPAGINLSRCENRRVSEMPSNLLSSKDTKVWKQEPRGKGQNDNKGVWQSLSGLQWLPLNSLSETQIEPPPPGDPPPPPGPTSDRGPFNGGSRCEALGAAAPPTKCHPWLGREDAPRGRPQGWFSREAGSLGGEGQLVFQIMSFCDPFIIFKSTTGTISRLRPVDAGHARRERNAASRSQL